MLSEFLLFFGRLNLLSLSKEKQKKVKEKTSLIIIEAIELFEYRKNNGRYWNSAKLYQQVMNKALLIAQALYAGSQALYAGYSLLFLFDNITSHSIYPNNKLRTGNINKKPDSK